MSATGPFIVRVKRPVAPDEDGLPFCAACSHYHDGACLCPDCGRPTPCRDHSQDRSVSTPATEIVHREAFATQEGDEGARARIQTRLTDDSALDVLAWERLMKAAAALRPGGTITLPNGDVIEVEAKDELWREAPSPCGPWDSIEEQCAAWNAEHGIGIGEGERCACGHDRSWHVNADGACERMVHARMPEPMLNTRRICGCRRFDAVGLEARA